MAKKKTPVNPWDLPKEDIKKEVKQIKSASEQKPKTVKPVQEKTVIVRVGESYKNRAKAKASSKGVTMQIYLESLIDKDTK